MQTIVRYLVLLLALINTNCAAPNSETEVTCTAGDVIIGQKALITCNFPDDIRKHEGVYLELYLFNGTTVTTQRVLKCFKTQLDSSNCTANDGFVLKNVTSHTLTVEIPAVTESCAGSYACQFVPPDPYTSKMCNLTVHGVGGAPRRRSTVPPAGEHCRTTGQQQGTFPREQLLIGIFIIVCLLLLFTLVKIIACFCRLYKKRSVRRQSAEENKEDSLMRVALHIVSSFLGINTSEDSSAIDGKLETQNVNYDAVEERYPAVKTKRLQSLELSNRRRPEHELKKVEEYPCRLSEMSTFVNTLRKLVGHCQEHLDSFANTPVSGTCDESAVSLIV